MEAGNAEKNIYITGNPKASFFSIVRGWHVFSVITGLLVGLKARSGEPKYGLLTRVKSKRNFGFLLGFYQYCSVFSGELLGWVRLWANFGPKSIKLTFFFHQMLLIFSQNETGTYRLLTIFFIAEKNMRSWKFDYKNMSLLVIRHMNEKILTFGFPGIYMMCLQTEKSHKDTQVRSSGPPSPPTEKGHRFELTQVQTSAKRAGKKKTPSGKETW
jgi:hypothetical protein